jgi:hypothetical protein
MKQPDNIFNLLPPLEKTRSISLKQNDVLITVAGFEARHLAAAKCLTKGTTGEAIILTYKPNDNRNDFDELTRELRLRGIRIREANIVKYDRFKPNYFTQNLKRSLTKIKRLHVILDISAMSKLAILLCLDVCRELNLAVSIHYAEATSYGPPKVAYDKAKVECSINRPSVQIYTGVQGVLRVPRFTSVAMQGQPTAAIAFMSFNEELIQALLNSVYPSRLFLVNGKPPRLKWREEATAWIHESLLKEWPCVDNPMFKGLPTRTASTLDYRESFAILRKLYWDLAIDHRVLLAPTGSKMQTISCFLIAALHPDVHIEYPTPDGFLDLYSEGIGDQWIVNFSPLGTYILELKKLEKIEKLDVPQLKENIPKSLLVL